MVRPGQEHGELRRALLRRSRVPRLRRRGRRAGDIRPAGANLPRGYLHGLGLEPQSAQRTPLTAGAGETGGLAGSCRASMYIVPPDRAATSTAVAANANGRATMAAARAYRRRAGLWAAWRASLRRMAS